MTIFGMDHGLAAMMLVLWCIGWSYEQVGSKVVPHGARLVSACCRAVKRLHNSCLTLAALPWEIAALVLHYERMGLSGRPQGRLSIMV